jgi:hypothetical protein
VFFSLSWSSDTTLSSVAYAWTAAPGTYEMLDTVYGKHSFISRAYIGMA